MVTRGSEEVIRGCGEGEGGEGIDNHKEDVEGWTVMGGGGGMDCDG